MRITYDKLVAHWVQAVQVGMLPPFLHAKDDAVRRRTAKGSPLTLFVGAGQRLGVYGSPVVPVWLFAPCSSHGLGGVAAGTAGA